MKKEVIDLTEKIEIIKEEEIVEETEKKSNKGESKKLKKNKKKIQIFNEFMIFYNNLDKKKKILFVSGCILFVVLVLFLIGSLFIKDDKNEVYEEKPIVIKTGNYKYDNGKLIFLDSENKERGTYDCKVKDAEKCFLSLESKEEKLDVAVNIYEDKKPINKYSLIYNDYVFVNDDETMFLYNIKTNEVVEEVSGFKSVYDNIVIIENLDNKFGFVNLEEEFELEFVYDFLGYTTGSNISYSSGKNDSGLINLKTKEKTKINKDITNYNDKYIVSNNDLYNTKNELLLGKSDFIKIYENFIFAFKNNEVVVYDDNLNKLNQIGIAITTENYTDYNIYDKDLKLIEKDFVINYEKLSKKTLKVEDVSLNLYQAVINSKLKFYSYYDGIIYLYGDEAKKDLIGSYACESENNITEETESYTSCYLLKDAPIINESYAFIFDTKTLAANDNIELVDLKAEKSLASYQKLDVIGYDKDLGITNTTENYYVKATNTKGYVGMINISSLGAKGFISFDYKYKDIKNLKNHYLATNEGGYKFLHNESGVLKTSSENTFKSDIVDFTADYSYLKINSNGKYQIYSNDGKIVSESYEEIVLDNNFYCALKDSKFNVYSYIDKTTNYFNENITLDFDTYEFTELSNTLAELVLFDKEGNVIKTYEISLIKSDIKEDEVGNS